LKTGLPTQVASKAVAKLIRQH